MNTPDRMASWDEAMEFAAAVAIASGWPTEEEKEQS